MAEKQKAEITNDEANVVPLERHYRVILDFRLLAREITPEVCAESFFFNDESASAGEPHFQENIERQRRLYALLLNDRRVLEHYLLSVLTQGAGRFVEEGLADAFNAKDEGELLVPLYKSMVEEDSRFFEECREMNALAENTDLITTAFKLEWIGAEVEEMNRIVVPDVKRAEIVEQTKLRMIKSCIRQWR